ncbi:hypothetical protein AKJ09_01352 [Labilithrix luteola]|uniref:Type IV fimbrial biogenesis protein PilY1 n=2 Tax=Labilithrix luteola TaxID=1391654 RepID=A0A0K1PMC2_9BACT|nr:hypothetical protein AKJ09_01352 [Labilithrix luteola]
MTAIATSTGAVLSIVACASDDPNATANRDGDTIIGSDANVTDGDADTDSSDPDAGPCTDCEWFPDVCTPELPCSTGPFETSTIGGAFDGRTRIHSIRGRSATDVWAVGALGAVAHFDGTAWTRQDIGDRDTTVALWLRDASEILLSSLKRVHTRGSELPVPDGGTTDWMSIDFWTLPDALAGAYYPIQLTSAWAAKGATWLWCTSLDGSPNDTADTPPPGLWRMRLSSDVLGGIEVAEGLASHTCEKIPCRRMLAIHGLDANEFWAIGGAGATIRVTDADSDAPHAVAFNSQTQNELHGVWTASATDAWSVGTAGTIRHYTGDPVHWDIVADVPVTSTLNAVWGTSSNDVWAVGDNAVVLHYDGTRWSRVPVAGLGVRRPTLTTVWASSPGHVWIGGDGFVLSLGGKP